MKNFSYLALATLMTSALVTSCSKDDDDDKKSGKKILAYVTGKDSASFTYNGDNLVRYENYELISGSYQKDYSDEMEYDGNKLINTYSYEWEGTSKTLSDKDSISYDSKGRPEKEYDFDKVNGKFQLDLDPTVIFYNETNQVYKYAYSEDNYQTFEYDAAGNVVKITEYYDGRIHTTYTYTYDNKKNPMKDNPSFRGEALYYSNNNILTHTNENSNKTYSYEYDGDGYPTKITIVDKYLNEAPETTTIKLYYR